MLLLLLQCIILLIHILVMQCSSTVNLVLALAPNIIFITYPSVLVFSSSSFFFFFSFFFLFLACVFISMFYCLFSSF